MKGGNDMTLTIEDLQVLKAPFEIGEHEFLNGYTYIQELPITERIEQVDQSWNFEVKEIITRDKAVTVRASLTIKGVTRDGVGMDVIRSSNEAEKSAATDALKRAARLFGIGRYLLAFPKNKINNENDLKRELNGNGNGSSAGDSEDNQPKESFTAPTDMVVTKISDRGKNKGQPYMVAEGCTFFSREVFRALGYEDTIIDGMAKSGVTTLPDKITIVYVQDGDYKTPVRVRRDSTGEIVDVKTNKLLEKAS